MNLTIQLFVSGLRRLQVSPLCASHRSVRRGDPRDGAVQRAESSGGREGEEKPLRVGHGRNSPRGGGRGGRGRGRERYQNTRRYPRAARSRGAESDRERREVSHDSLRRRPKIKVTMTTFLLIGRKRASSSIFCAQNMVYTGCKAGRSWVRWDIAVHIDWDNPPVIVGQVRQDTWPGWFFIKSDFDDSTLGIYVCLGHHQDTLAQFYRVKSVLLPSPGLVALGIFI